MCSRVRIESSNDSTEQRVLRTELEIRKDSVLIAQHSALWRVEAMKNILSILLIIATVGVGAVAQAQQAAEVPRVGHILAASPSAVPARIEALFRQGLRELGYVEGKNIVIERRHGEGK